MNTVLLRRLALAFPLLALAQPALAKDAKSSASRAFDRACTNYYRQGNDEDVQPALAAEFCGCLAGELGSLGKAAMDFFARTYSEDLTTFMHEYPKGEAWMQASFRADKQCKDETDYGSNEATIELPLEAASWGGVVRAGPGTNHRRLTALAEGEHIMLLENTGVMFNDYPWWKIEYAGRREGYQWGGIICALGSTPIEGVFETCDE